MSLFLTPEELVDLTMKQRSHSQECVLRFMGIPHKLRPDGSIAVLREHITKIFGGAVDTPKQTKKQTPNWAAI